MKAINVQVSFYNTWDEIQHAISLIETDPCNTIGGRAAFFSGKKTQLTATAAAKVAKLNAKLDRLDCDE